MPYERSQMVYNNGDYYKWSTKADRNASYYKYGTDYSELNRAEGYEVLYFINHLLKKRWPEGTPVLDIGNKIEVMIRYFVPENIKAHYKIEIWIADNWATY